MTKKERYTLHQNGNYHTVIDEEENVPLIMIEFKENEFPVYACFHRIIDLLNEQDTRIKQLQIDIMGQSEEIEILSDENQQLKERNQRQYNRVKELTELMYERQWGKLENMVEEWEKADELLQKEWHNYGDL